MHLADACLPASACCCLQLANYRVSLPSVMGLSDNQATPDYTMSKYGPRIRSLAAVDRLIAAVGETPLKPERPNQSWGGHRPSC